MGVEASRLRAPPIVIPGVSRQRDQNRPLKMEILTEVVRNLEPAHAGHTDIAENHFGCFNPRQFEHCLAVVSRSYVVAGESQQQRHAVRRILVVVDQQDSSRRRTLRQQSPDLHRAITLGHLLLQKWQTNDQLGPPPEARTRSSHTTSMQLDHVAHQGQSNAQPLVAAARRA